MRAAVLREYNADLALETVPDPGLRGRRRRAQDARLRRLPLRLARLERRAPAGEARPDPRPRILRRGRRGRSAGAVEGRRPSRRAFHPRLRQVPDLPVRPAAYLPRPAPARLHRARRLRGICRRALLPQSLAPAREPVGDARRRPRLPGDDRLARADRARRPARRRMACGPWHRRHRPLDADPRQGSRRPGRRRRHRPGEARPRALARRRRCGQRP